MGLDLYEVDPERRAAVAQDAIANAERQWRKANRRPPTFSAREALQALEFESLLVAVAAANLAVGYELTETDRERLWDASARVFALRREVLR